MEVTKEERDEALKVLDKYKAEQHQRDDVNNVCCKRYSIVIGDKERVAECFRNNRDVVAYSHILHLFNIICIKLSIEETVNVINLIATYLRERKKD